ncbi:MAG: transglutaminase-like domain-containing protein [Dehalococcoidia bacterium]
MTPLEATLERFRETVAGPPDEVPLARAALLIAQGEYPHIDIDAYERRLQDMAETLVQQIARQPARPRARAMMQTVNQLLFRELGFRGNADHYEDRRNLYMSDVLSERTGVPVTLAIVYAEVCQRAGLDVQPVGLPGHVICRYTPAEPDDETDELLLDVFNGGRILTRQNCQELVRGAFGARVPFKEHYLASLLPRQVLQRLLHNLKAGALQHGDEERAARAIDFLLALYPWDLDEIRDRGMLRERLGEVRSALSDLEQYVRYRAGARDIQTVSETVRSLRRHAVDDGGDGDGDEPRDRPALGRA